MKIRIEPNDIQYMGMSGYSAQCLDAIDTIVTDIRPPKRLTLVSRIWRPERTSPSVPGEHLFLIWDWNRVPLTVVHSGFATGYPGTGPRYFSLALCLILSENIEVASMGCKKSEFDMIDERRATEQLIERFRYRDMLDSPELRNEWIGNGWIYPAHLKELENDSFWSYYCNDRATKRYRSVENSANEEGEEISVNEEERPTAFISYSWDDESHKSWVKELAARLRKDGIDAKLDRWEVSLGDSITEFMETAIRESDFVLIICTPSYKERSDNREGGVGYEESVITGEVFTNQSNRNKFIPVLRSGKWTDAAPSRAKGGLYADLSGSVYSESEYARLRDTLLGRRETAPPIGGGL